MDAEIFDEDTGKFQWLKEGDIIEANSYDDAYTGVRYLTKKSGSTENYMPLCDVEAIGEAVTRKCMCDINSLMVTGCRCGAMEWERSNG